MLKKSLLLMLLMALLAPWAAKAQGTLTVCEGTTQNQLIPFYAYSGDTQGCNSEFIIPASELTALNGKTITAITFSVAQQQSKTWTATYNVYLAEVSSTTLTTTLGPSAGTIVYTGTVDASSSEMTITFDDDYTYNGGNLLVGTYVQTAGAWDSSGKFYGIEAEGAAYITGTWGGNDDDGVDFIPQTTFTYLTDDPWISLNTSSMIVFTGSTQDLTASYGNVTGTPTITYSSSNPKIASVSGSGTSATVTGESVGTATITATMTYNATDYTATCAVTVEEPSYCTPSFSYTSDYINSFTTTGGEQNIDNQNSGQGTGGYSNFYDTYFVSAEPETEIGFSVVRGYSDTYNYAIWVDWNKDYEFDNTTEKVAYTASSTGDWTGSFTIPTTAAAGDYHMRVIQVYSYAATPCVSANYGEGEDYKLTVLAGNPYQKPTDLTVIEHGPFNATIGWTAPSTEVVNYQYQYMPDGGAWTALTSTTALNAPLSGLTDDTDYTFRVKAIYTGGESDFATKEFSTDVACEAPTNLTATDITADGATLGWTSDADNFNIRYRTAAYENKTFFDDFESNSLTGWTVYTDGTAPQSDGWYTFKPSTSGLAFEAHSGSYCASAWSWSGSSYNANNWLISPQVTFSKTVKFWVRTNEAYPDNYEVLLSTTGTDEADFTETLQAMAPAPTTGAWEEVSIDLTAYSGTGYIAIHHVSNDMNYLLIDDFGIYDDPTPAGDWKYTTSNTNSKPIDGLYEMTVYDFEVQAVCGGLYGESDWVAGSFETLPNCMPVSDLDVAATTAATVTLVWTDNNGGSATYVVTDGEDNPVTVTGLTTTGCTVTGLIANTAYTFKVKADCGGGYSTAETINVRTDCNPITTIPYEEGFEGDGFYCWTLDGFAKLPGYAHDGANCIYATGSVTTPKYVILPEMGEDISGLMLNFWYYNYNSVDCGTLYVGYLTDDSDYSTFATVETIDMSTGLTAYEQTNNFTFVGAPAGSRMALKYVGSGGQYAYLMIDDATVDVLPACMPPYDLEVDNTSITAHGATFSWTSNGSETEWHLYFSKEDTAPANDIPVSKVTVADSNPFTMTTGLDPETNYYVWVRASCGGTDGNSSWVGPATFTTGIACPAPIGLAASEITGHTAKLSWNGTSESYVLSVGTYDYTGTPVIGTILEEDFEDNAMQGWTTISNDNDSYAWSIQSNSSFAHESNYCVRARYTSSSVGGDANDWLISPQIAFGGNISFYAKRGSSDLDKIQVYVSTTGNNISDFTAITEEITLKTTYEYFEYDLSSYSGKGYVAIVYTAPNDQYYVYVDDITITGPVYPIAWNEYNTTDTYKTVEGFDPETPYFAKVKGNCDSEGYSQETAVISFTTDVACPAPTGLAYSNPKSDRVTLSWTTGGSADWVVAYKKDTDSDFTTKNVNISEVTEEAGVITYVLEGLASETNYIVKVQDNCEPSYTGDGQSVWTSEITFETLAACAQPTNVTVSNITHYNADVAWTGDSDYYIVQYRTAASVNATFSEEFNTNSLPTGWARYSTELTDDVLNGTTALTSTSSGWSSNSYGLGQYNWKVNIYSSSYTCKYWMVTPSIAVGDNNSLSFDMALTKYNSSDAPAADKMPDANSRFVVLITDDDMATWTILREWNNSGSADVLNSISNTGTPATIDLSAYANSSVKIAFYCQQLVSGPDCDMHIDNVKVGTTVPAGAWLTLDPNPTTTAANLTSLTAGTKYDVQVAPSCEPTLYSEVVSFTTVAANEKYFLTEGEWGTAGNWMDNDMPTLADNVKLQANATIASTDVAQADLITLNGKTLTINDGGQLKTNNNVTATVKKHIKGYGAAYTDEATGYYLIANPLNNSVSPYNAGLTTGNYDLYSFSYTQSQQEWRNFKNGEFSSLLAQSGYLYANESDVDLAFTGTVRENSTDITKSLNYATSGTYALNGWNLVGNPFACNAYTKDATSTDIAFYRMNNAGSGFEAATGAIKPMEGIFVKATATGQSFDFTREQPITSYGNGNLNISLANVVTSRDAVATTDKAIVRFDGGGTLEKFMFREDNMKIYIPQDGTDFAVVASEAKGVMPVNVKVTTTGEYTISISNEDVDFTYLHLIDRLTGEDVDLLIEDSYTFYASPRDQENRFTLVFNSIDSNIDATSEIFAYQNGDQIIVSGEGTLQVFDVMGRFVANYNVNGTESINASQFENAVYIFRLVGTDVKTQKIVVR